MELKEEKLGGTLNRVVKIGDTVRRQVQGGSILHSYLQYLEKAGMEGVPRFLGIDEQGREILTYLPGKTQEFDFKDGHPCLKSEETIIGVARFMRKLHDISVGFLPEAMERAWINPKYPHENCETICHNDAAVWNFVFTDERISGLFDFDKACASTRIWDLTMAVYGTVHLLPWVSGGNYEASKHATERKRRVKLFFDTYGMDCPPDFMDMVSLRIIIDLKGNKNSPGYVHYHKVSAFIKEYGRDWI